MTRAICKAYQHVPEYVVVYPPQIEEGGDLSWNRVEVGIRLDNTDGKMTPICWDDGTAGIPADMRELAQADESCYCPEHGRECSWQHDWTPQPPDDALRCPECGSEIWDMPSGSKLAKCWNSKGHFSGGSIAFDTMTDDEEED